MTIFTNNIKGNLLDIITKATTRNIIVTSLNEVNKNDHVNYELLVKVQSKNELELFIDDLKTLSFVDDVKRY